MDIKIFREYKLKFYLNARHYIIIDDHKSDIHPHTWEIALHILIRRKEFVQFGQFENRINEYLGQYQNQVLNEVKPFMDILPTLENMIDYFSEDFVKIIRQTGGELVEVEGSEGPSRSYILDLRQKNDSMQTLHRQSEEIVSDIIDDILDDILD